MSYKNTIFITSLHLETFNKLVKLHFTETKPYPSDKFYCEEHGFLEECVIDELSKKKYCEHCVRDLLSVLDEVEELKNE